MYRPASRPRLRPECAVHRRATTTPTHRRLSLARREVGWPMIDPILTGLVTKSGAQQSDHACLDNRPIPHSTDGLRQSFQPVTDRDARIVGSAVLDLGQHRQPELGESALVRANLCIVSPKLHRLDGWFGTVGPEFTWIVAASSGRLDRMDWVQEFYSRSGSWWGKAEAHVTDRDWQRVDLLREHGVASAQILRAGIGVRHDSRGGRAGGIRGHCGRGQ
jgi:hypothetical protein